MNKPKWKPVNDPRFNCMAGIAATSLLPKKLIEAYQEYERGKRRSVMGGNERCAVIKKGNLNE